MQDCRSSSRRKPRRQKHWKEPALFWHVWSHPPLAARHSSTSTTHRHTVRHRGEVENSQTALKLNIYKCECLRLMYTRQTEKQRGAKSFSYRRSYSRLSWACILRSSSTRNLRGSWCSPAHSRSSALHTRPRLPNTTGEESETINQLQLSVPPVLQRSFSMSSHEV